MTSLTREGCGASPSCPGAPGVGSARLQPASSTWIGSPPTARGAYLRTDSLSQNADEVDNEALPFPFPLTSSGIVRWSSRTTTDAPPHPPRTSRGPGDVPAIDRSSVHGVGLTSCSARRGLAIPMWMAERGPLLAAAATPAVGGG